VWYGTIETPPQPCADISVQVSAEPTALRWMGLSLTSVITATVTNNGPNPATPSLTVVIAGDGRENRTSQFIVNGSKTDCTETGGGKGSPSFTLTCTSKTQLATGES